MKERHDQEQYFFNQQTVDAVADLLEPFERPCVLCAPMVGIELEDRGTDVVTLDIDERFNALRSFRRWDLYRPERIEQRFGVIFVDPPFFGPSLSQLFHALRVLAHFDFTQRIAVSYLVRRRNAVLGTFVPFMLRATGFCPGYRTVKRCERNDIEVFANFELKGVGDDQG